MEKILIVDDVEINRDLIAEMLENEFEVVKAEGGRRALELLEEDPEAYVVVLLDLMMPHIDGFAVLEVMNKKKWLDKTAVIVISGEDSRDAERRSLKLGASDYIRKSFDPLVIRQRVKNMVDLFCYKRSLEKKVEQQTETLRTQYQLLQQQAQRIQESNTRIIDILGTVVECRSLESGEHIWRVKEYTRILAEEVMKECPEYALTEEIIARITSASALHDIGKIAIPDSILLKPGKLTDEEFAIMKTHSSKGSELLQQIEGAWDSDYAETCYEICRYHHERYDGRGYPDGLKGEEIPISAQIVSIADVYDALVHQRVYKDAFPVERAYEMILSGQCGVFSPKLLKCFHNVKQKFEALVKGTSQQTEK